MRQPVSRIGSFLPKEQSISARPATIASSCFSMSAVDVVTRKKMDADACSAKTFNASPPDIKPMLTVVEPKRHVLSEFTFTMDQKSADEQNHFLSAASSEPLLVSITVNLR